MSHRVKQSVGRGLRRPLCLVLLVVLGLLPPASYAQEENRDAPEDRPYWRENLFRRVFGDQKFLFTTWMPSEVRRPGFYAPLLVGAALGATSEHGDGEAPDLESERSLEASSRGSARGPARMLTTLGDASTGLLLVGAGYFIGRWSGHDRLAEASSLSAEAALDAGLWSTVLKGITARTRPIGGASGRFFDYNPEPGQKNDSFPSGHATGAFAVATVFAGVYRDHRWVPWLAYGTAGLIGVSRVALGRHFPSDVLVGGLLGNSLGRMVLARREGARESASSFEPFVDPAQRQAGFVWARRW